MLNPESVIASIDTELRAGIPNRNMTAPTWEELNGVRVKTRANMERLKTKRQAIQDDRSLSPEGQRAKIAALANDAIGDYASTARMRERLATDTATPAMFMVKSPISDPVVRQLRNQESRDSVRGLNQNERDVQFLEAAERDHDELLDAMLDAPGGPLVSADMKRRALDARARRRQPEAYANWEQAVLLRDELTALLERIALCLVSMGADPQRVAKDLGVVLHDLIEEQKRAATRLQDTAKLLHA
jgi:hypothetical protein